MKTLYIHVGQPKTGTTALQVFCLHNRKALNQKGYDYPFFHYKYEHTNPRRNGHFLVGVVRDSDGKRLPDVEQQLLREGLEMVEESFRKYDHVILSDERLWHASKGPLFEYWNVLKKHSETHGYAIKMIVYLRRQDIFATSWRNQMIKNGFEGAYGQLRWDEWIKKTPGIVLDYYWLLEKIAGVIGKENIRVRIYDRAWLERDGGSIYTDFCNAVDLQMDNTFVIKKKDPNPSLTLNLQEIKRVVNNFPKYEGGGTTDYLGKAIRLCAAGNNPDYPCSMFSVEELKEFLGRYEEGNNKIAKEYLHREGPLFDMTIRDLEKWTENNPYMYEDIIRYFRQLSALQPDDDRYSVESMTVRFFYQITSQQQEEIDKLRNKIATLEKDVSLNKARLNKLVNMAKHPSAAVKWIFRSGKTSSD